jgi:anaerobic dimethyl sulfoxide reductase subunit A
MSEENILTKALSETLLTRRSFLKWSAALGGTAVMAGKVNFGLKPVDAAPKVAEDEGKWISVACWHNCGGRCPNYALVKDGVVLRQKTHDLHPDSPEFPQQRACARGHSQQWQVLGADRLKYPMKRKNWESGGGKKELRGKDEWVRISWDEALDILASEVKRIKETYGNEAILRGPSCLNLYGGYVGTWGSTSTGTWQNTGPRIGMSALGACNDRLDLLNCNLFVMWAENPIWSSGGNPTYYYLQAKKAGAKFIFVDPYYNESAMALADEWIPIRPATDHAMLLGMAYIMFTEDDPENNPLIDWDFVNRCTIGITKDTLPEGVDPEENFRDYVLGLDFSGHLAPEGHKNYPPKTPEWASKICGVPPEKIKSFTIEMATTKPCNWFMSWAPARVNDQQHLPTAMVAVGCMTGNIGMSGGGFGPIGHAYAANNGPSLVSPGSSGVRGASNPISNIRINNNEIWDAILTGKYTAGPGGKTDINIKLVYFNSGAMMQTRVGQKKAIEAIRSDKVEFVVSHAQILTTNAKYSDLVLPVTTEWERWGTVLTGSREILIWASQALEPMWECKDDDWINVELGKRLGFTEEEISPLSLKQQIFNRIAGATVIKEDGSGYETLVTITPEDLEELGVEGEPQEGRIPIMEFKEKGIYQVERYVGDNYGYIAFEDFRKDPKEFPLTTESGKIEIHCRALVDAIYNFGWSEIRPIPAYIPATEGYEDTFEDFEKGIKGSYPLQLFTIHYPRRSHTVFDNIPQLRKAFPQEFYINPIDAEARGVKHGDTILVTSRHGQVLRKAYLTERIIPGVTILPHGAWVDIDEDTGICKAGSDNMLNGDLPNMEGHMGWNSCNVQVEKWTGAPLIPDYKVPQRIPLKEA